MYLHRGLLALVTCALLNSGSIAAQANPESPPDSTTRCSTQHSESAPMPCDGNGALPPGSQRGTARVGDCAATTCGLDPRAVDGARLVSAVTVLDDVNGGKFRTRPSHIATSSDTVLGRLTWGSRKGYLTWNSWNRSAARGVGTYWVYCGVDCMSSERTRVTLSHVRNNHFTKITLRTPSTGQTRTFRLVRGDVGWYWQ